MNLSRDVVKQLILDKGLVTNFADVDEQLTANGFDVRVAAVVEIVDGGKLAVKKENNRPPKLGRAFVLKGFEDRLKGYDISEKIVVNEVKLEANRPYFTITCEEVNMPEDLMFHIVPRSSLFRFTQSLLHASVTEAGYRGYLAFMLVPLLNSEIELGTRFAQFVFSELKGKAHYEQQKFTNQQGGKLF
jgi:deoxycytidine triphosphate deaminase